MNKTDIWVIHMFIYLLCHVPAKSSGRCESDKTNSCRGQANVHVANEIFHELQSEFPVVAGYICAVNEFWIIVADASRAINDENEVQSLGDTF